MSGLEREAAGQEVSRGKRAFVIGVVGFALLWPFAQRGLVGAFDLNAWKLAGFAMYTTPTPPVQVALLRQAHAGLVALDETKLSSPVRAALGRFRIERHALGRLRRPDRLGALVLESQSELPWVIVAVQRMHLDRESARMTSTRDQYVYERSARGVGL